MKNSYKLSMGRILKFLTSVVFVATSHCAHHPARNQATIDREGIRIAIRDNVSKYRPCYDAALKRDENVKGKIEVVWQIGEEGVVQNAKLKSSTVNDEVFEQCVVDVTAKITFPAPPPDQIPEVVYPFVFATDSRVQLNKAMPEKHKDSKN